MAETRPDLGFRPKTYTELRQMEQDQMIAVFDSLSPQSRPGGIEFNDPNFWLAEIRRLDVERINQSMLRYTRCVTWMTGVITIATLVMIWATFRLASR